jgi:hypothetical protein
MPDTGVRKGCSWRVIFIQKGSAIMGRSPLSDLSRLFGAVLTSTLAHTQKEVLQFFAVGVVVGPGSSGSGSACN